MYSYFLNEEYVHDKNTLLSKYEVSKSLTPNESRTELLEAFQKFRSQIEQKNPRSEQIMG